MAGSLDAVWVDVLPSMEKFFPELAKELPKATGKAGAKAGTALGESMGEAADKSLQKDAAKAGEKAGDKMGESMASRAGARFGKAIGGALVGFSVVGVAKGLYGLGSAYTDVATQIATQTGATGAELDKLTGNVRTMSLQIPASAGDIADAMLAVRGSMSGMATATQKELTATTQAAMGFSKAFEIDISRASQVAGQMITNGFAKDGTAAFDLLTAAAQKVPPALREDLLDAVDEYGPAFRQAGVSGERMMSILAASSSKGMFGIDKTGDAIKELGIRMTTADGTAAKATAAIGLNYDKLAAGFAKGGAEGDKAFSQIVTGLQKVQDPTKRAALAMQLFGTPLEDLNAADIPQFLKGLQATGKELGNVSGASKRVGDATFSGPGASFQKLTNTLQVALAPAATYLFGLLDRNATRLQTVVTPAVARMTTEWQTHSGEMGKVRGELETIGRGLLAVGRLMADHKVLVLNTGIALAGLAATYKAVRVAMSVYTGVQTVATALSKAYRAAKVEEGVAENASAAAAVRARVSKAASTAATWASTAATKAWTAAQWLGNAALSGAKWAWSIAQMVAHKAAQLAGAAASGVLTAATWAVNTAVGGARWAWATGQMVLHRAAQLAGAAAAGVLTAAQWALNVALNMNPIGLVIIALVALGVAFAVAWKKSDTFRQIVTGAWNGIKSGVAAVWQFLRDSVFAPLGRFFTQTIPAGARSLKDGVMGAWNGLKSGVFGVWTFLRDNVLNPMKSLFGSIPGAANGMKDGVGRAFDALKGLAAKPVNFLIDKVYNDGVVSMVSKIPGASKLAKAVRIPGFRTGGFTGNIAPDHVAGVVHGHEYVLTEQETRALGGPGGVEAWKRTALSRGYRGGGYVWPTTSRAMSGNYSGHSGVDIPVGTGTPLFATGDGIIDYVGYGRGYGNAIFLRTGDGVPWVYGHGSQPQVRAGQQVKRGQQIGLSGNTGRSTGPHLHIEAARGGFANAGNRAYTLGLLGGSIMPAGGVAGGGGIADLLSPILDKIKGFLALTKKAADMGPWGQIMSSPVSSAVSGLSGWASGMLSKVTDVAGSAINWVKSKIVGKGAQQWEGTIRQALEMNGLPTSSDYVQAWLRQVQSESSGNPNAVQGIRDVNSGGNEARGLLQVIPPTFRANAFPGHTNIYDPLDNALAAVRYAKGRYGSRMLNVIGHGHGYKNGTLSATPGPAALGELGLPELITGPTTRTMRGGETVHSSAATRRLLGGGDGGSLRLVEGTLSIDEDGEAWIKGLAAVVVEDYADQDRRMGHR